LCHFFGIRGSLRKRCGNKKAAARGTGGREGFCIYDAFYRAADPDETRPLAFAMPCPHGILLPPEDGVCDEADWTVPGFEELVLANPDMPRLPRPAIFTRRRSW